MKRSIASITIALLVTASTYAQESKYPRIPNLKGMNVAVIAETLSCGRMARFVLRRNSVAECRFKNADMILTIVRSSLDHPLDSSYDSIGKLKEDAESQLNLSGSVGHIYVYRITDDLEAEVAFHSSFDAEFIEQL